MEKKNTPKKKTAPKKKAESAELKKAEQTIKNLKEQIEFEKSKNEDLHKQLFEVSEQKAALEEAPASGVDVSAVVAKAKEGRKKLDSTAQARIVAIRALDEVISLLGS